MDRMFSCVSCVSWFFSAAALRRLAALALACSAFVHARASSVDTNEPAPAYSPLSTTNPVEVVRYDWFDAKRDRKVPVKIYVPKSGKGPFPVIIFSHGLGGSREGYEYLGRFWAGHGYVSVHLQHPGSDSAVLRGTNAVQIVVNLRKAAANPENAVNRPLDVSFAIDRLQNLNREEPPLEHRLDLDHIGMAGHSFGAFTALAIAGEVFGIPGGKEISFADSRVKAALVMSPPVPVNKSELDRDFGKIKIPCLFMTGTEDFSPIGDTRPEDRRLPFDHIRGADHFLLTLNGGDHMVFSGRQRLRGGENDRLYHRFICESSLAFWDAYLKQNPKAKAWLMGEGFKDELGAKGTFEERMATRSDGPAVRR